MTERRRRRSHGRGPSALYLPEPALTFGHAQAVEDPRDGLTLFGPLDEGKPYGLRAGVIGTERGIAFFGEWLRAIQGVLTDKGSPIARPPFPGFQTVFRVPWAPDPVLSIAVPEPEIMKAVNIDDRHQRVFQTVGVFTDRLLEALRREDVDVDLWFVVIPDVVHQNCRPRSNVAAQLRVRAARRLTLRGARALRGAPSLFVEDNILATVYQYEVDFHHQLKARLLAHNAPTQIVRESTIAPPGAEVPPKRDMSPFRAAIAWNLSTAAFYKGGYRPWKISQIRPGVCYVGMVFKRDETQRDPRAACCAAQMFLDSGDGLVFRGAVGPWYSEEGDYHLDGDAAHELGRMVVSAYKNKSGNPPTELFIHGRAVFSDDEWAGFENAVDASKTTLVGVTIRDEKDLRLYRLGTRPVLRGTAWVRYDRGGYLWTKGYAPRLQTYVGREVPRPLRIDVVRGNCDVRVVFADIMALTKLNYNTCQLADGMPVTLRFANAVGEILTAAPNVGMNPLPFKHYI